MEIQFHPASGGARVKTLRLGPAGERWLVLLAGAAVLLAASLFLTVPVAITRAGRREGRSHAFGGSAEAGASRERVLRLAREIRDRALDRADYLNRARSCTAFPPRGGPARGAVSPQLHYEYWRPDGGTLHPTDPLFAALDRRLGPKPVSLEEMAATSAPGPLDPLPGLGAPVSGSPRAPTAGSRPAPARKRRSQD